MELREGETIIHNGRPHCVVFGWAILLALLSARFVVGADFATSREATQTCLIIAGLLAFYAIIAACVAQAYRWSSRLTLTNRRVVLKTRILRQRSSGFLLPTIESVLVESPVTGRVFNYGTLTVRGFGRSREFIKRIPRPEHVRELIQQRQSFAWGLPSHLPKDCGQLIRSLGCPAGAQTMRFFYLTPVWCMMCVCEPTSILTTACFLKPAS